MINREQIQRSILATIGIFQGIVFWIAYNLSPQDPHDAALVAAMIYFVTVCGLILQFVFTGHERLRHFLTAAAVAAPFASVTLWVWWQIPEKGALFHGDSFRLPTLAVASIVALYVLLPYLQIFRETGTFSFPYTDLFRHSWNNFFIVAIGFLVAGLFWGLISLCVALFKLIGVSSIGDILYSVPFACLSLPTMFGFGIALGRESNAIINTLTRITLAIFRALLPLLALIALLFLAALPITGLQPLWDTKSASPLLLSVLLFTILFINAVFQDGTGPRPYSNLVRRGVEGLMLAMPIYSGLVFYAIGLRIDQYGLTPDRFYVVVFALIAAIYSVGYAIGVIMRSSVWMGPIRPVNITMSLFIAAVALLTHTPVLDPLGWSARNQYGRLTQGKVNASVFDYGTLRFHLGRMGYAKLRAIAQLTDHPQAETIRSQIELVYKAKYYNQLKQAGTPVMTAADLSIFGPSGRLPEGLLEQFKDGYWTKRCVEKRDCVIFSVNLDADTDWEYALVTSGKWYNVHLYDREENGHWRLAGRFRFKGGKRPNRASLLEAIKRSEIKAIQPPYKDLEIAGSLFELQQK